MTRQEKGKHCASCNKVVVDLSLYSDKELLDFFKNVNGKICGRVNKYQLNRDISYSEPSRLSYFFKMAFGATLASWLGMITNASAQEKSHPYPVGHINTVTAINSDSTKKAEKTSQVKGRVIDVESKTPIAFANVSVETMDQKSVWSGVTDTAGSFSIAIPQEFLNEQLIVNCSSVGYEGFTSNKKLSGERLTIKLKEEHYKLQGDIMYIKPKDNNNSTTPTK